LTPGQLAAVREIMRLLVEEDLDEGVSPRFRVHCDVCHRPRQMAGFVLYEGLRMCNACATEYEIARLRRLVNSAEDFLAARADGARVERVCGPAAMRLGEGGGMGAWTRY
jgi:hypothetical protein